MRILWICGARVVGGAERVTLQLAELLRGRGHIVEAVCPADSALWVALSDAGIAAYPGRLGGALNLRAPLVIGRTLQQVRPNVALVTTADEWVWSCLIRRPAHTRLVLVRHMVTPLPWQVRWLAARRADAIVAVSDAVRRSLQGGAGLRNSRLHRIYNPVRFTPRPSVPDSGSRARARAALGLNPGVRWVGFFGGLNPAKGIGDVLGAVRRANAEWGATHLLLCGPADDSGRRWLNERLRRDGLDGLVHDFGEINCVEDALTAVDVVVNATQRRLGEALPATLIEAMACGTPVLAYATGGIPEVVGADEAAGRLVQPDDAQALADALVAMLADADGARRMATAALGRARDSFDPQRAAERYEQLFLQLTRSDVGEARRNTA